MTAIRTGLAYDERCLLHDNGSMVVDPVAQDWIEVNHAENAERVRRAMRVLDASGVAARLELIEVRPATTTELCLVHDEAHVERMAAPRGPGRPANVGPEARAGSASFEAALLSAGAALEAVDFVMAAPGGRAYSLTRPPGHHASAGQAMGFCLFNNAAISVRHAQRQHGLKRAAILDWDVHHGNGSQAIFYNDPSVLFISIHQDHLYPEDLGTVSERGEGDGVGTNLNLPLPAGTGDPGYLAAVEGVVLPALARFDPDLIVLSSGQDAGACDPLGRMSVTTEGFRLMTSRLAAFADEACQSRLVAIQEGGYSIDHMPFCVLATVEALAGFEPVLNSDPVEMDVPTGIKPLEIEAIRAAARAADLA